MKIIKVEIKKFRNLEGISLSVGKKLTAFAGQNGTSKTSLLGIISHIFNFKTANRTLTGGPFYAKYSEIFRFSYPDYDRSGQHIYKVVFENNNTVDVVSYDRTKNKKPTNLRLRVGKSARGRGKIKMPAIYLGLKRLFPFSQESNIAKDGKAQLTINEAKFYKKFHNDILLMNEDIEADHIITKNKDFFAPRTKKYDHLGISAGQDNLGQIASAIISFQRLKEIMGEDYPGGMIFIDELDASLYPAAQLKLVEKLFHLASDLGLQIFFTTHSLEVLEAVSTRTRNGDCAVIYLDRATGSIKPQHNPNIDNIRRSLRVSGPVTDIRKEKINIYLEDDVAKQFAQSITEREIKSTINYISANLGYGELIKLSSRKLPDLKNSIFIVDGDQKVDGRKSKVFSLPGNDYPELVAYNFLQGLSADHAFWSQTEDGFTKQFCFKNCSDPSNKDLVKNWFKDQRRYLIKKGERNVWEIFKQYKYDSISEFNSKLRQMLI